MYEHVLELTNFYENARRSIGELHVDKFIVKAFFFIVQTVSVSDEVYYSTSNGLSSWL